MVLIKRWLSPFKQRGLRWLNYQMKKLPRTHDATISASAQIRAEGQIENIRGGKAWIRIGENTTIDGRLLTYKNGGEIQIGEWCYVGLRTEIWSMSHVTIGNRVLIAHNVNITDCTAHPLDAVERHKQYQRLVQAGHPPDWENLAGVKSTPIFIEDDVWISFGVTILRGVTIGARSVIAAGSIVTKDVPPDTFYRCEVLPILKPLSEVMSVNP